DYYCFSYRSGSTLIF
nr:immunoglobulin light chain junction region [Macaca mulatta]